MPEKILIVDDDYETVKFLALLIKNLGYEPLEALNGMDALKLAHENPPNLIILDVMMPGLDGFEVARSLRRHPETALIPILMYTAKSQVEDKLTGYESGVDIYLTKPVHSVELTATIKALLLQKRSREAAFEDKGYTVGVIGAKGGMGVSTVVLNLAIAYKQNHNAKVIAAEMRPGQGSWMSELGLTSKNGLASLLRMNRTEITGTAVNNQLALNTYGVPLLLATDEECGFDCMTAVSQYEAVIEELSQAAELVVLDIGTNFHPAYEIFTQHCDEIIVVTEPQPFSVKRTRTLIENLKAKGYGSAKALTIVMLNRTRTEMTLNVSQIEEAIGQSVALGFPPAPELAYMSATQSTPMYILQADGIISQQYKKMAEHLAQHVKTHG